MISPVWSPRCSVQNNWTAPSRQASVKEYVELQEYYPYHRRYCGCRLFCSPRDCERTPGRACDHCFQEPQQGRSRLNQCKAQAKEYLVHTSRPIKRSECGKLRTETMQRVPTTFCPHPQCTASEGPLQSPRNGNALPSSGPKPDDQRSYCRDIVRHSRSGSEATSTFPKLHHRRETCSGCMPWTGGFANKASHGLLQRTIQDSCLRRVLR